MSSLLNDRAFMRHFEKSKMEAKQQMNCLIDGIYANLLVDLLQWYGKENQDVDDDQLDNVANEPNLQLVENPLEVDSNDVNASVITNEANFLSSSLSSCSPSNSTNEHMEPNLKLIENPLEVNPNNVSDIVSITNEANEANCLSLSPSLSNFPPSNLSINDVNIKREIIDNFTPNAEIEDDSSQSSIIIVFDSRVADCLSTSPNDKLLNQNKAISDNQTASQNEIQTNSVINKRAYDCDDEEESAFEPDDDELDESGSESESSDDNEIATPKKRARIQNFDQKQKCPQCTEQFSNGDQLQVHLEVHDLNSTDQCATPFQCEYCGVCFSRQWKLTQHLVKHRDERPFACDQCDSRFKRKKDLQTHRNKVHNRNALPIESNVIVAVMQNQSEGSSTTTTTLPPTMVASVEKPFGCHFCTTSFKYEDTRNRHEIFIHKQQQGK